MNVTLQGGEPFYRKDLNELVGGIVENRMRFNILSNGTLITDEMAALLASTGRCDGVQVSIDGSVPTTHDACRGEGNFLKAMQGIKSLQKYNVSVPVRVTVHKHNVRDLENVAKLLLEDIGLPSFSTNVASYMGLCRKNTEQVPLAEGKSWLEMEKARRDRKQDIPGRGHLSGCNGPMETLAVRADGVMVPCIQMSHMELGRINRDSLQQVWQQNVELNRLRERHKIPLSDFEFCQGCEHINYCTGNCPALAYTILGKEDHPSPDACLKRFLEAGGRLPEGIA
jgi:radical SAM protein with 4Fe4S-binding SPASM domain